VNVLFTSVGRRVELMVAFRQAYQSLDLTGNIVAVDIDPLAPAAHTVDRFYIVPRTASPDYPTALADICRREKVGLVFPLIDPDIPVLAQHRQNIEATGARLAVVSPGAAAICSDKWRCFELFQELGLPAPISWLPEELDGSTLDYPLFIKPRFGSAGKNAFLIHNRRELAFFVDYVPDPIIQEYLPGPEITNDVICDLEGEVLGISSRQRIEVRWGEVAKGVTLYDPAIARDCVKIARALPAIGPITVQCMIKDETPHFTEINARFGGGLPLGITAGVDAPRWLLARAAGLPIQIPPLGSYRQDLYLTRYDSSRFLTQDEYDNTSGRRI
jgi:carbamoyl-phosphate synthase large subunit